MFWLFSPSVFSRDDAARLWRIEQKLDLILHHLGLEHHEAYGLDDEVRRFADDGRKIDAIRAHRQRYGSSLLDAKRAVDAYMQGR